MIYMTGGGTAGESKAEDLIELGVFYFLNGRLAKAIEVLSQARDLAPQNAEVFYNLGLVYEARNSFREARDMYEQALKLAPGHKAAKAHLDKLVGV